ncbi:energy-coupling factor ABC transporter ATP-binding protein [Clostridium formicaceticum]|uniref:ABC transporter n=1 Tax=Clostridium formicaceticum TaxID=1497 RepID=A0AAC9RJV9_9CLOT|nr:ABC transporter ATP-binding protein [Clostridium formicaceticum]AOY76273.1 ABC transporter [Clostridium formicaceticum]ARE86658.1 Energy-coupling factor transporter ATP-binding protein EcfA1 [Clostridium formicaceticum]
MSYLTLENINFAYGKNDFIIKNISLQLWQEDFTAVVGPNGSGKTTLGKLMAGLLKPQSGTVAIDGTDSSSMSLGAIGKKVGYLFQNPEKQIFAPTVYEELTFPLEIKGIEKKVIEKKAKEAMEIFQISHLSKAFPFTLSQGEKQRLALAAIFLHEPGFFILDEPTTGLDRERKKVLSSILKSLQKEGVGMAVISHDEAFVEEHATRVIKMIGGEIIGDARKSARS